MHSTSVHHILSRGVLWQIAQKNLTKLLAKIDLSKTKIENLKRGRDSLREKITNYYKDKDKWPKTEDVHNEIINAVEGHTDTPQKTRLLVYVFSIRMIII